MFESKNDDALGRFLERAAVGAALALAFLFVLVALVRMGAPFDLEWMENGMAMHALRLTQGEPLYAPPSLEWIPFLYPPLYPAVVAAASTLGDVLVMGRLTSLLAALGAAVILGCIVGKRTGARAPGLLAAGLFLATYPLSGFWFDLVRVDALALFLTVAGVAALLEPRPSLRRHVVAGVAGAMLLGLAVLTKQTAIIIALGMLPALWRLSRLRLALYGTTLFTFVGGAVWFLQDRSDGWFWTYTVSLPAAHAAPLLQAVAALGEVARQLPVAAMVVVLVPLLGRSFSWQIPGTREGTETNDLNPLSLWLWPGLAALVGTIWSRAHSGSYDNVFMLAHWFGILALALFWGRIIGAAAGSSPSSAPLRRLLAGAILFQAGLCLYHPGKVLPEPGSHTRAQRLEEILGQAPEPVFFPDRPLAVLRAGHPSHAHGMAISDLRRAGMKDLPAPDLDAAYRRREFAAVIVRPADISRALEENYAPAQRLTDAVRATPFPVTGWYSRQLWAFRPRPVVQDDGL